MTSCQWLRHLIILCGAGLIPSLHAADITVSTTAYDLVEDGGCSLREAVRNAKNDNGASVDCVAGLGADRIFFDPLLDGQVIVVTTRLVIDSDIALLGRGADLLSLSGDGKTHLFEVTPTGLLRIEALTLTEGSAPNGGLVQSEGLLIIRNSTLSMSDADTGGGALFISASETLLEGVTLSGNRTDLGGAAIENLGSLTLINSTVSDNWSFNDSAIRSSGSLTLRQVTVAESMGNGLQVTSGNWSIINSVITDSSGQDCLANNPADTEITSLISDASCQASFSGLSLLGPLTDNGGTTLTHAPEDFSALREIADPLECEPIDQRGVARPLGIGCDIGAVEATPGLIFSDSFETLSVSRRHYWHR